MRRHEFMRELSGELEVIAESERREILYDYEEHFSNGLAEGKTEEEIARSLGNPQDIAKEIMANYRVTKAQEDGSMRNMTKAVLATLSLGFINLVFVLGPLLGLIGTLFGFYCAALALIGAPFFFLLEGTRPVTTPEILIALFSSMMSVGMGLLIGIAMIYVTRWTGQLFLQYLKLNIRIIKGV